MKYQYIASICVNLSTLSYGLALGWSSPMLPMLLSDLTPLKNGKISLEEASWLGSIICIGAGIGSIIGGYITNSLGRKTALIVFGIIQGISWILLYIGNNVPYIFISRLLSGIAIGGCFVSIQLYIPEIANPKIRGTLGSYLILSATFGVLIGYIVGEYLSYFVYPLIGFSITIVFLFGMIFLPETPQFLINNKRFEEAKESLRFFQRNKLIEDLISDNERIDNKLMLSDFKCRTTRKGIFIGSILIAMTQFCGTFTIINYTASIFRDAGSNLSPNICAIIVAIIQLLGTYTSCILVEKLGRKVLLLFSSLACGIGLISIGIYFYLKHINYDISAIRWWPLLTLSEILFVDSTGIVTLPYVVINELLPQKLRHPITSLFMTIMWFVAFFLVKYFTYFVIHFNMYTCMWFFATCCISEHIFLAIMLPETKGKSFDEICAKLKGNNDIKN